MCKVSGPGGNTPKLGAVTRKTSRPGEASGSALDARVFARVITNGAGWTGAGGRFRSAARLAVLCNPVFCNAILCRRKPERVGVGPVVAGC